MFLNLGLALLFFLPVIESYSRSYALVLLLFGSLFIFSETVLKKKIEPDRLEQLFLVLLPLFAFSVLYSLSPLRSLADFLRYVSYFIIFVSVRRLENTEKFLKRLFIPMLVLNSFFLSVLAVIYSFKLLHLSPVTNGMNLFYPVFGHNHITDILIFSLPVIISTAVYDKSVNRTLYRILSVLFTAVLFLSTARGAMISLVFSYLIFIVLKNNSEKKLYSWVSLIGVLTAVFLVSSFVYSNFLATKIDMTSKVDGFYKPAVLESRFDYFYQAFRGLTYSKERLLHGTGLDTFRFISRQYQLQPYSWSWYTHNYYLEMMLETGIAGGLGISLLIAVIIIIAGRSILKKYDQPENHMKVSLLIGLTASSIHSLIDFDWQFLSVFLIFWVVAALILPPVNAYGKSDRNRFQYAIFIILGISFILYYLIVPDVNTAIAASDRYLLADNFNGALSVLNSVYRFDKLNTDISRRIAYVYQKEDNAEEAHRWYQLSLVNSGLDSEQIIKADFSVYIGTAQYLSDMKFFKRATEQMSFAEAIYPYFFTAADITSLNNSPDLNTLSGFLIKEKEKNYSQNITTGMMRLTYQRLTGN